jgi:hypothetical protein
MTFHTQYPIHRKLITKKIVLFYQWQNIKLQMFESELQLSLEPLCFSPYTHFSFSFPSLFSTCNNTRVYTIGARRASLQAKLVVSNHHSKRLSNGKITMMEICSKSDENPSYCQPLNGDLISSLCEGITWLFQPVSINFLDHSLYSRRQNERAAPLPSLNVHHVCKSIGAC